MTQRYALFFDIDGTLVSFRTHEILQAGIGVAMGNAIDALKQQADYVTTSVDDDGILNALRHFQVI